MTKAKMSVWTVSMLIVVTTFGFANVIDNLVALGPSAIPSWVVVGVLYFLPLALILAEFASDTSKARGGIYSYMERGLGPTWAFVGTWSYFVSNLVYLQSSFSKLPIRVSLAITGTDAFESHTLLLPPIAALVCVAATWAASRGVQRFSRIADWVGIGTLVLVAILMVVPIVMVGFGAASPATPLSAAAMTPAFDLKYFATFSWLLFAVAGAEVAAPYVRETRDPQRSFPRAILLSTLWIALAYVFASVAVAFLMPLGKLTKATGMYDVWLYLAEALALPGVPVARACMTFLAIGGVAAYVIWMESPIRAMFTEVPKGTFPRRLTASDAAGTHRFALWCQAGVVVLLIMVPMISLATGERGSERFISLLNDTSSLSLVVPYAFLALSYVQARRRGMDAPFKMVRSTRVAVAVGIVVVAVSALGYCGAGLYALEGDPIDWPYVGVVYGGPVALVGLGFGLRGLSLRRHLRHGSS